MIRREPWRRRVILAAMPAGDESTANPVLDSIAFRGRLREEVARVERSGGFLSLALIGSKPSVESLDAAQERLDRLAHHLKGRVRVHDVLARRGACVALLMPETGMAQAAEAIIRLLGLAWEGAPESEELLESAGVATIFGPVEGGLDAMTAAAEDALQAAAPGAIERSAVLDGRPRVLVVDDDPSFAQILAETVSDRGWEGHPCSDTGDALQRVQQGGYSGLFVDLVMPRRSGVEILRAAMSHHPRRPAVLMSGKDIDHELVLDALSLGPVTFVRKPIAPDDLDRALQMFRDLLPGRVQRR
jgi:CheY-like chemotaxis protein